MNQRTSIISGNIQDQVYTLLKNDVIYGVYEPGAQMKEMELAQHFQVSRSPIREALRRLCGDGLLELRSNCGMFVRVFSPTYVRDLLRARVLLETQGMRELAKNGMSEQEHENLLQIRQRVQYAARNSADTGLMSNMEIDAELHTIFNRFNHNEILDEMWQRMTAVNVVVQRYSLSNCERSRESQDEHLKIIDYLLGNEFEQAIHMNDLHIAHTLATVELALKEDRQSAEMK